MLATRLLQDDYMTTAHDCLKRDEERDGPPSTAVASLVGTAPFMRRHDHAVEHHARPTVLCERLEENEERVAEAVEVAIAEAYGRA